MKKFNRRFFIMSLVTFPIMLVTYKYLMDISWTRALFMAFVFLGFLNSFLYFQALTSYGVIANVLFYDYALEELKQYEPELIKEKKNYSKFRLKKKKWPFNKVIFRKTDNDLYIGAPYKIAKRLEELKYEKA